MLLQKLLEKISKKEEKKTFSSRVSKITNILDTYLIKNPSLRTREIYDDISSKRGKIYNFSMVFLIFVAIGLVIFEGIGENRTQHLYYIFFTDLLLSIVFFLDWLYRFTVHPDKWYFFWRFRNFVDILSFLPFFIMVMMYGVGSYTVFVIFRIFRIFKVFELFQKVPIVQKMYEGIYIHRLEYQAVFFIMFIILLFASSLVYQFERNISGTHFHSILQSFWWAIVTMTTVGYGDLIPQTIVGRIIGGIIMILGPVMISIVSAITLLVFLESTKVISYRTKYINKISCSRCDHSCDSSANYCEKCGNILTFVED